jgi:hypothetical protein
MQAIASAERFKLHVESEVSVPKMIFSVRAIAKLFCGVAVDGGFGAVAGIVGVSRTLLVIPRAVVWFARPDRELLALGTTGVVAGNLVVELLGSVGAPLAFNWL